MRERLGYRKFIRLSVSVCCDRIFVRGVPLDKIDKY